MNHDPPGLTAEAPPQQQRRIVSRDQLVLVADDWGLWTHRRSFCSTVVDRPGTAGRVQRGHWRSAAIGSSTSMPVDTGRAIGPLSAPIR